VDAVIGLGSNLGDRRSLLAGAIHACARLGTISGVSRLYESEPVGPPQPLFLNAALRLATDLEPEPLLDRLLEIEREAGRVRGARWGPRRLDLDLLWVLGRKIATGRLRVPHPELELRAFALLPLLEVAPGAAHPETGRPYAEIRASLRADDPKCVAGPDWWG
jgi:2-amino-4-hydroxy-6-hydroxymethyldihydropteridine diphosphokinase